MTLLIVGVDGASWSFMRPLLERGALPHLKRLADEGVTAPLKTLNPSLSPAVWTTIATGHPPSRHGITGWDVEGERPGARVSVNSRARATESLWTILSRSGRSVAFVSWWGTWPAEPVVGAIVSERYLRQGEAGLEGATYPTRLAAELDVVRSSEWPWLHQALEDGSLRLPSELSPGLDPNRRPSQEQRLKLAQFFYGQDYKGEQAALHLVSRHPRPELLGILLRKVDIASHYFARFLPPSQRDPVSVSRLLEPVYGYDDALVARLASASGPALNVIVLSDHGFERTGEEYDHKRSAPDGVFIAWGPAFARGLRLPEVSVFDITPTVLHVLGLPVGRDMQGRVLENALAQSRPVRWVATHERGSRVRGGPAGSPHDERLHEELRALGYVQ